MITIASLYAVTSQYQRSTPLVKQAQYLRLLITCRCPVLYIYFFIITKTWKPLKFNLMLNNRAKITRDTCHACHSKFVGQLPHRLQSLIEARLCHSHHKFNKNRYTYPFISIYQPAPDYDSPLLYQQYIFDIFMTASLNKHPSVQFIDISTAQAGQRIDNFLLTLEKGVPKSRIYRAIRTGEVRVNKGRIKQTYKLKAGDSLRVPPLRVSESTASPTVSDQLCSQLAASVLVEDDDLLIMNKPPGLAVHAGSNITQGIIEALRICRADLAYLELVHRLDRDTSGCLLLAKNREALLNLQQQMIDHDFDKHYLTLLKGHWGQQQKLVEYPLLKNTISSGERMVRVDPQGKSAKTLFLPIEQFSQAQLTEVILYTGRTHQIRVHSAEINHPIAGDDKYGHRAFNKAMKKLGLKRMFLHASKLVITHPRTHQSMTINAPLPEQLNQIIERLRQQS